MTEFYFCTEVHFFASAAQGRCTFTKMFSGNHYYASREMKLFLQRLSRVQAAAQHLVELYYRNPRILLLFCITSPLAPNISISLVKAHLHYIEGIIRLTLETRLALQAASAFRYSFLAASVFLLYTYEKRPQFHQLRLSRCFCQNALKITCKETKNIDQNS